MPPVGLEPTSLGLNVATRPALSRCFRPIHGGGVYLRGPKDAGYGPAHRGAEATGQLTRGARAVADRARTFAQLTPYARPVLVNGAIGALIVTDGTPFALVDFTVSGRRITEIDVLADPGRLVRPGRSPGDPAPRCPALDGIG